MIVPKWLTGRPCQRRRSASRRRRRSRAATATGASETPLTRSRDRVRRVVHAGVHAGVGHERGHDADGDARRGPGGADAGREGERRSGMPRGPRCRARHLDLAADRNVVRVTVRPATVAERLEHQVDDARGQGDRRQAVLRGAAAAPAAERGEQRGAAEPQPRVGSPPGRAGEAPHPSPESAWQRSPRRPPSPAYSTLRAPRMNLPPQRPVLFINPVSGGGKAARAHLAEAAKDRGIEPVVLRPGEDLGGSSTDAVAGGADALGMAGGDGSLGVVASAAGAHGLPFVCVPAGTRNHFARDLGVPPDDLVARARRVRRRRRAPDRPRRCERSPVSQQRHARGLRDRRAAGELSQREAPHAARDRPGGARAERGAARRTPRRRPRRRAHRSRRRASCPTTPTPCIARGCQGCARRSTAGGWESCWSTSQAIADAGPAAHGPRDPFG